MQEKQLHAYIDEIKIALLELAETNQTDFQYKQLEKYFGTQLQILGLSMGDQRMLYQESFSFSNLALEEKLKIYYAVWKQSTIYEVRFQSVFFIIKNAKKLDPNLVLETINSWMETVDCWPHSDDLAKASCIAGIKIPKQYKSLIQEWNTSELLWKRRQSAVALVRERKAFVDVFNWKELEKLFLNLIDDKTYMVQKGLGWALRDTGRIYNQELLRFLDKYATALSTVAFSTATEKIDLSEKEVFKQKRIMHRKK
ncbi:MAG: DNA alkylation repair protein [Chitinophagales bacterium]|nr:DNA alkylation repair protein [Bacteroidota bacterium]MBK8682869.1 DNA alkylation repair protein [Bacteroidota bacterium]